MFIDNSAIIFNELEKKVDLSLRAIGELAGGYAKQGCPVDTGRLRNSITYATPTYKGPVTTMGGEAPKPADTITHSSVPDGVVVIGTNVEYAAVQEYGDFKHTVGGKHYLLNAATAHGAEYKRITRDIMRS